MHLRIGNAVVLHVLNFDALILEYLVIEIITGAMPSNVDICAQCDAQIAQSPAAAPIYTKLPRINETSVVVQIRNTPPRQQWSLRETSARELIG